MYHRCGCENMVYLFCDNRPSLTAVRCHLPRTVRSSGDAEDSCTGLLDLEPYPNIFPVLRQRPKHSFVHSSQMPTIIFVIFAVTLVDWHFLSSMAIKSNLVTTNTFFWLKNVWISLRTRCPPALDCGLLTFSHSFALYLRGSQEGPSKRKPRNGNWKWQHLWRALLHTPRQAWSVAFVSNNGFATQCLYLQRAGTISPSFIASVLDSEPSLSAEHDADLKFTANSMYAASADTVRTDRKHGKHWSHSLYSNQTIASVSHLLLAMMYYPVPFQKARDEISRVIGTERLPTFDDRASLPYGMYGL